MPDIPGEKSHPDQSDDCVLTPGSPDCSTLIHQGIHAVVVVGAARISGVLWAWPAAQTGSRTSFGLACPVQWLSPK